MHNGTKTLSITNGCVCVCVYAEGELLGKGIGGWEGGRSLCALNVLGDAKIQCGLLLKAKDKGLVVGVCRI